MSGTNKHLILFFANPRSVMHKDINHDYMSDAYQNAKGIDKIHCSMSPILSYALKIQIKSNLNVMLRQKDLNLNVGYKMYH